MDEYCVNISNANISITRHNSELEENDLREHGPWRRTLEEKECLLKNVHGAHEEADY
jgi:hypothetical protein